MDYYYICLFIFCVLAYFIVTDESVAKAFYFVMSILKQKYEIMKWWILHNPRNPVVKYFMWRRSMKLAKELQREFDARNREE